MSHLSRRMLLGLIAISTVMPVAIFAADYYSPRQYYSGWQKSPKRAYYFRRYYYKPHADYAGYKHNYVILYPNDTKHCYYYNPYKKQFWGRCSIDHGGKPEYSMLAVEHRKPSLSEIPLDAFPAPGPLPPLPESTDGVSLDLPPDDLPPDLAIPE